MLDQRMDVLWMLQWTISVDSKCEQGDIYKPYTIIVNRLSNSALI